MKKKLFLSAVCLVMVALFTALLPLQVLASYENDGKYIREIRIGYGQAGKDALTEADYKVLNIEINKNGNGSTVYLGYKTTDDKNDAITDLAIFSVRTGDESTFDCGLYEEEVAKQGKTVNQLLENVDETVSQLCTELRITRKAGLRFAVYGYLEKKEETNTPSREYEPIPRAIIEVKENRNGENANFVYYAVGLAGASDDYVNEKDTTKLYGDLNGLGNSERWACLYYTKDARMGSPLLASNITTQSSSRLSAIKRMQYLPVHGLQKDGLWIANNKDYTPMNLNEYNSCKGYNDIHLLLKRDTSVAPLTGSLVESSTNIWVTVLTALIGVGLVAVGAWIVVKRKKKAKQE